jgi:hypothetical protein
LSLLNLLRNSPAAKAFGVGLPGVPSSLTALTCHHRKPGDGGRSAFPIARTLRPFLQSTSTSASVGDWNAFRLGPFLSVHQLPRKGANVYPPDTAATMTTGDARTFRAELARLIKKSSTAGLSNDDMADELTEAAEDLTSIGENESRSENDPVGYLIASHRP